jgi:GntR family transcriptional regulator / MocR family aminotransferase
MARVLKPVVPPPLIPFDREAPEPLYRQIYNGFRSEILSGRLRPGQLLPSTRSLARDLQVSRIPVVNAFALLTSEGYIEGRLGSGTYVSACIPEEISAPIRWRPLSSPLLTDGARNGGVPTAQKFGPFRVSLPAFDHLPRDTLARLMRRHVANLPMEFMGYGDPAGYLPLREALATYLRAARAVNCEASQIIIVPGSHMGMRISAMALTNEDSIVCVEEPGYTLAKKALRAANATVVPVSVDDDGIDVAAIRRLGRAARLVHVTPSHQYPLGTSMSIPRRIELTDWANRQEGWILEDDYDSEFRYKGRPLSSMQGMDTGERVIYVGTFSKSLFPALRLGYVVAPASLVEAFAATRETLDLFPPILPQMMLADFMREGHFTRHLRRMRSLYQARRDVLVHALETRAGDVLTAGNTDAGLHLVAFLPPGVDDLEVVRRAALRGLFPSALSRRYATSAARSGLLLGFGASTEDVLTDAVDDLADVIRGMR